MSLIRELLESEDRKTLELTDLDSVPDEDVLKAAYSEHKMMIAFHKRFIGNALVKIEERAKLAFENQVDRTHASDDELDDVDCKLTDLGYDIERKVLYALVRCKGDIYNRNGPEARGQRKHVGTEHEDYAFKLTTVDDAQKVKYKEAYQIVNDVETTLDVGELCKLTTGLEHYFL